MTGGAPNYLNADLDMNVHKIINVVDPTDAQGAATKHYVDAATTSVLTTLGAQAEDLDMNVHKIINVTDPTAAQNAATKNFCETVQTASVLTSLGPQAENLDMNTHKIVSVTDPANAQDAATKNYVDAADTAINAKLGTNITKIRAYMTGNMAGVVNGNMVTVQINTEDFDTLGEFNTGTYTFTCTQAGYYCINAQIDWGVIDDTKEAIISIFKNGAQVTQAQTWSALDNQEITCQSRIFLYLNVGNTIDLRGAHLNGDNTPQINGGTILTYLEIFRVA